MIEPDKRSPRKPRLWGWCFGLAAVAVVSIGAAWLFWPARAHEAGAHSAVTATADTHFIGSNACSSCHGAQFKQWQTTQHSKAMARASERSVLANFANARVRHGGITSTFFRRDDKFFVRTDGARREANKLSDRLSSVRTLML